MKAPHYILVLIFFIVLSMLNALVPVDINTLLLAFLIVYLMRFEND